MAIISRRDLGSYIRKGLICFGTACFLLILNTVLITGIAYPTNMNNTLCNETHSHPSILSTIGWSFALLVVEGVILVIMLMIAKIYVQRDANHTFHLVNELPNTPSFIHTEFNLDEQDEEDDDTL